MLTEMPFSRRVPPRSDSTGIMLHMESRVLHQHHPSHMPNESTTSVLLYNDWHCFHLSPNLYASLYHFKGFDIG